MNQSTNNPAEFRKGARVQQIEEFGTWAKNKLRCGTVIGRSRSDGCVRVAWDGNKTHDTLSVRYLRVIDA